MTVAVRELCRASSLELQRAQRGGSKEATSWTLRLREELEPAKHRPGETVWEGAVEERPGIF